MATYPPALVNLPEIFNPDEFYQEETGVGTLAEVLAAGNNGANLGIVSGGAIGCSSITTPFGFIDALETTTITDIATTGVAITPTGTLKIKGATTKGSLLVGDGTNTIELPTATNGLVLKTNSGTASGLEWGADGLGVSSITAGLNIGVDATIPSAPVVRVLAPLTSTLDVGSQSITSSTGTITITPLAANDCDVVVSGAGKLHIQQSTAGGQANPSCRLSNTNATGSVAMEVYKNKPSAVANGDVLFNQSVYGNDSGLAKQEYTRITHTIRDGTAGVEDGSIEFGCFVNNAFSNFLQINGNENEVNCLKVLDMGGNNIRTNTGSLTLDGTTAPNGSGNINLNPRATAVCNVNGGLRIPSTSNNIVIGTSGSGFYGLMSSQGTNYTNTTGSEFGQIGYGGIRLAQGTLFAETRTNIQTFQEITLTDAVNPAENLTASITPTGIGLLRNDTGSGVQQSFSFNNDSASGGTINYNNTIGSNGIVISSNRSIELSSVAGLFFLTGLPTSSGGLPTGALWNNSGVLSIV